MSAPEFVFSHKTGELQRGGKLIALCRLHADIFMSLANAQGPIGSGAVARAINMPLHAIEQEYPRLAKKLGKLGILIVVVPGRGRFLQFEDVPSWRPNIPPPIRLVSDRIP